MISKKILLFLSIIFFSVNTNQAVSLPYYINKNLLYAIASSVVCLASVKNSAQELFWTSAYERNSFNLILSICYAYLAGDTAYNQFKEAFKERRHIINGILQ